MKSDYNYQYPITSKIHIYIWSLWRTRCLHKHCPMINTDLSVFLPVLVLQKRNYLLKEMNAPTGGT